MPLPSVFDEIDRLFDELVRRPWGASHELVPLQFREAKDGWVVDVPVGGLRAGDLKIEVGGGRLTVSGQKRREQGRREGRQWTHMQEHMSLHRTIPLPPDANPDDVEASIEGSTLSIHIGRRQKP